jgi:hypothetical protein
MTARSDGLLWAIPAVALLAALAAASAPLAVYTLTLAAFGVPHVLSELRYVDRRFARRIAPGMLWRMLALLVLLVVIRSATVFHAIPAMTGVMLELSTVVLLALNVAGGSFAQRIAASLIAAGIGLATWLSPYETTIGFSIFHNLTPLGFLWQILPPGRRAGPMSAACLGFLGLPLFVATGLPREALAATGLLLSGDPLGAGPLASHLYVYVPRAFLSGAHAIDLFSASAVAQVSHYFSVIVVLPLLLARTDPNARGIVPWPRAAWFFALLAVFGAAAFARFSLGFPEARALYGIAASVHAWVEIPLLILALTAFSQAKLPSTPAANDAAFATSETSIAR